MHRHRIGTCIKVILKIDKFAAESCCLLVLFNFVMLELYNMLECAL